MVSIMRFGRKIRTPSTVQIRHQLLTLWLKDQVAKEAAEDDAEKAAQRINRVHVHEADL
jgi:hypothetical protein